LKTLYEARGRLSDLLSKLDGNDELAQQLKALTPRAPANLALDANSYPGAPGNGESSNGAKGQQAEQQAAT
jgi:hypothetical protein